MSDNAPGRDRRPAIRTFVIADIRGWTRFTAEHGDEAAARLARKFAEVGGEGVEAWGGEVVELRGDELLAVFDSARDALRAAVELQAAFAAETTSDPSLPLSVGIGIDAGEAVPVGDGYRGAALNVAARLCAIASSGDTITSHKLVELAGHLPGIDYVQLEATSVKGLAEPISPVKVSAEPGPAAAATSSDDATRSADAAPLPADLDPIVPLAGRARELRWLTWHWRRAGHGAGRAVVVSGSPGIGKTRLAAEIAVRVQPDGASVSYWPAGGLSSGAPMELPEARPALIVVDDLDAAPPAAARQVMELAAQLIGQRVLLLVTHREEATPELLTLVERTVQAHQRHTLGPLEPTAIRAIAALYAGRAAEKVPIAEVLEQSGGVPAAVHRWSSAWARASAAERLQVSAEETHAGRQRLRAAEAELIGDVAQLEVARERTELYGVDAATTDAALAARRDICPYKGLAAFDADDADYYFGRERLVAELIARLVGSSFLALVGASGSGKSSALRAGLLPALAGGVLPGSAGWRQAVMRPGEHPTAELERVLGSTLAHALNQLSGGQRLVLVVDQFEEVFNSTRDEAERAHFIDTVTSEDERLKVVLAMRADHYGQGAAYSKLARLLGTDQVLVGAMASADLGAVIEHPAERVGLRVEPKLTDALLADLGEEPGALPLLSTALLELWQARESGRLTLAAYRASGGVQGAVARLAENAYGALSAAEQVAARGIFLRLAGTGEGEAVVRRRVALTEFDPSDELTAEVLRKLTNARLLTSGDGHVEVAHEALLREWPRLRAWLEEDAATRQLRLHLIGAARDWEGRGRESGDLYRGARLAAAIDWAAEHGRELNPLEREFIDHSRRASEAEAERQHRTNRRLRALLAGAGALLVVAVAAGGYAVYQAELARQSEEAALRSEQTARDSEQSARQAEQNARDSEQTALQAQQFARSRELAASAIAARDEDPTLSKLLAIESASIADPPVESVAALHRAWDADRIIYRYNWPSEPEVAFVATDLDPSGRYIAASGVLLAGPHDYVEVVDRGVGERLWSFRPSTEGLATAAALFTPDATRVVFGGYFDAEPTEGSAADEAGIYVRDALTGAEIKRIDTGSCGAAVVAASSSTAIAFTSTATTCITFGNASRRRDLSLESIDLTTGERTTLTTTAAWSNDEDAVSADGLTIAFNQVGPDPEHFQQLAMVARPATGQLLQLPVGDFGQIHDLSSDGSRVLLDVDGKLQVWDLDAEDLSRLGDDGPREFAFDPDTHGAFAQFAPDAQSVFSTGGDGRLHQWDIESGEEMLSYAAPQGRPSPNADGLVLVPSAEGPTALLIDTSARAEIATVDNTTLASQLVPNGGCGNSFPGQAVTAVGSLVATTNICGQEGSPDSETLTLLDRASLEAVGSANGGFVGVLSPDGTRLARRMDRIDGDQFMTGPVEIVDVSSGNSLLELEGLCWYDRTDPNEGQLLQSRQDHANPSCNEFPETPFPMDNWQAHAIRWSPDGTMIAMVDLIERYFAVWNASDGSLFADSLTAWDPSLDTFDVAFSADSKRLLVSYTAESLAGAPDSELATISTTDWRVEATRQLSTRARNILLLGSTADASSVVAVGGFLSSSDKTLYWIDPATLADARPSLPRIHSADVVAAAISADGTLVAVAAADGSIGVWDSAGRLVNKVEFPGMGVMGVAFISDTHLAVVLDDGNLRVVTLDTAELLRIARESLTRGFTQDECDRYKLDPCPTLEQMQKGEISPD